MNRKFYVNRMDECLRSALKLPDDQRAALLALSREQASVFRLMASVIDGNHARPDEVFPVVQAFLARTAGPVTLWNDIGQIARGRADLAAQEDECYRLYGLQTRIPLIVYREFLAHVQTWLRANEGACDPALHEEINASVAQIADKKKPAKRKTVVAAT